MRTRWVCVKIKAKAVGLKDESANYEVVLELRERKTRDPNAEKLRIQFRHHLPSNYKVGNHYWMTIKNARKLK